MKANLYFTLNLPYLTTQYAPLKRISVGLPRQNDNGTYCWEFPIRNLGRVEELIARKIEFDAQERAKIEPKVLGGASVPEWKGKGRIEVVDIPNAFQITEYRKTEEGVVEKTTEIPKESVKVVWKVVRGFPSGAQIKTRTVAEKVVRALGITRFDRESSRTFDWEKFFGCRMEYYRLLYLPLKVLAHHSVIIHHKNGFVERVKDDWVLGFVRG